MSVSSTYPPTHPRQDASHLQEQKPNNKNNLKQLDAPAFIVYLPSMIKTCPQCGELFTTANSRRVYCKLRCRDKHKYQLAKQRDAQNNPDGDYWEQFRCYESVTPDLAHKIFQQQIDYKKRSFQSIPQCIFKFTDEDNTIIPSETELMEDSFQGRRYYVVLTTLALEKQPMTLRQYLKQSYEDYTSPMSTLQE